MWPARNPLSWKINYDAVKILVKLSKQYNIKRFVHIGTATSFGHGPIDNPGTESSPYSNDVFKIDYQDTKFEAQQYLLKEFSSSQFPVIILNPTFMLGKYDSGNGSNKMVLYIYKGKLPGYSPGGKNFVNVKDVAVAAANSLKIGKLGECYITAGKNMSYKDGFTFIAKALDVKPPKFKLPRILSYSFGGIQSAIALITRKPPGVTLRMARIGCEGCYYTPEKAIKELNMPQSSLEDAIHDSIDWFKEIGKV
jgi:dihydroflavonol-4-reductase